MSLMRRNVVAVAALGFFLSAGTACSSSSTTPPATATFTISGTVTLDAGGAPLAGVSVALSGVATGNTLTNASGVYTFPSLASGSYGVAASKAGYAFTPSGVAAVTIGAANATQDFVAATAQLHSIQGTVSGAWVEKVVVTLTGGTTPVTATTNATGGYQFGSLPEGVTYTVTPALAGYTYAPDPPAVSLAGADATANFVASSAVANRTISGTVSYAGTGAGTIYVGAYSSTCTDCSPIAGTSLASTASPRSFLIRGLPPGSYVVLARLDTIGNGSENGSLPSGQSGAVDVSAANATGIAVTVTDPTLGTPAQVTGVGAMPGNGAALIFWDRLTTLTSRTEIATGYRLQASASNTFPADATTQTFELLAHDDAMFIHAGAGVAAGSTWYYRVAAKFGATVGAYSAAAGPYTLTSPTIPTGGTDVAVQVTFTATASGPLYVGLYAGGGGGGPTDIRFVRVASPVTGAVNTITNVPAGTWTPFAILDQNGNGVVDTGDLNNTGGQSGGATVTVPIATTVVETLSSASALVALTTQHTWDGLTNHRYGESAMARGMVKQPVKVIAWSGLGIPVPFDVGKSYDFRANLMNSSVAPVVGGNTWFRITYSDGTVEDVSRTLDTLYVAPSDFATGLTEDTISGGCSPTIPCFDWTAPAAGPVDYGFRFHLDGMGTWWDYPQDGLLAPAMTTATFNSDSRANASALSPGNSYQWMVSVVDPAGNQATKTRSYSPPTTSCTTVNLLTAGDFALLAKTAITNVPTSAITGDLGISPAFAASISGFDLALDSSTDFSTSSQVTGRIYAPDYFHATPAKMTTAIGDMEAAFTDAASKAPGLGLSELGSGNIGGKTLTAGCYKWSTGLLVPTDVTLTGSATDIWVFMIAQDLTFANGVRINLAGGALAKNIFWQVSGLVSVGTTAHVEGIVLSQTAINLATGASVNGRLLAQSAVALDSNAIVQPAP